MQTVVGASQSLINIVHSLGLECLNIEDDDEYAACVNFKNGISVYVIRADEKAPIHYEVGYWSKRGGEAIPEHSKFIVEEQGPDLHKTVRTILMLPLIWEVRTLVDQAIFQSQPEEKSTCKLKRV